MVTQDCIEQCIEVIEQIHNLDRIAEGGDCCEAHYVAEVDGYLVEVLRLHRGTCLQRLSHRSVRGKACE